MTEDMKKSYLKKVELQVEINRMKHGERRREIHEWAMIVGTHLGHLLEAVLKKDKDKIETEILQIAAPLLELYKENVNSR